MEPFNGKLRDGLLNTEAFNTRAEARVLIGQWRRHYNTVRPHSSLGHRPPAPEVKLAPPLMLPGLPEPTGSAPPRPAVHRHFARNTPWGLDRAAGSYNGMLAREGDTPPRLKKLKTEFLQNRKINKTELAKCFMAWAGFPHIASQGLQKNFETFSAMLEEDGGKAR